MSICPVCHDLWGFHDENVHAARPLPEGAALVILEASPCRACGEPLDGPGLPDCRYPKHFEENDD